MTDWQVNAFGRCLPLIDEAATCRALNIVAEDRVLEVGGGGHGFARANVVCDLTFGSSAQRNGAPAFFKDGIRYVEASVECLPFADREFDFVYCTQVLEHVVDPIAACRELSRVARRGFVEVPSRFGEALSGNPTHRWIIDLDGETMVFSPRTFIEHPLDNVLYGMLFRDRAFKNATETTFRNLLNHQIVFEGRLSCRVNSSPAAFDYSDPSSAGRAHLSFARNVLLGGADPRYAYVDAQLAVRYLPDSRIARLVLAHYQLRLLEFDRALETLEGLDTIESRFMRDVVSRVRAGETLDLRTLPMPAYEIEEVESARAVQQPLVSIIVFGNDERALEDAAQSALTQDYAHVEVIVAGPCSGAGWSDLQMGDRLRLVDLPPGTPVSESIARASIPCSGEIIGFLEGGHRFMAHHVDRLVAQLVTRKASAVHGDRIDVAHCRVIGPDIDLGNPSTAGVSLSTMLARREFLAGLGGFDERYGARAAVEFMVRAARLGAVVHVREATVLMDRSSEPLDLINETRSFAGIEPLELLRALYASHLHMQDAPRG